MKAKTKTMPETAYNCKDCDKQVLNDQALRTFTEHERVLCADCEAKISMETLGINQNDNENGNVQPPQPENKDTPAAAVQPSEQKEDTTTTLPQKQVGKIDTPILDSIHKIVGNDLCQIFGDTGEGKSKFVHAIAVEAIAAGLKVFYLDTERNLGAHDIEMLGDHYRYTPKFSEMQKIVDDLGSYDLVIIDSVGLPVLNMYAKMKMNEQGKALLNLIGMMGDLKNWTYDHDAIVIVTNQPESEFNKAAGHERRPFGDKSLFNVKEVWKIRRDKTIKGSTKCIIESFRSREMMKGTKIATMDISDAGVEIMMRGMEL